MNDGLIVEDVISDLKRMQDFDAADLIQRERLGADLSFDGAVEPASNLISLFKKLPADSVLEFPVQKMAQIQAWSKSAYKLFEDVISFRAQDGEPEQRRQALIQAISNSYETYFTHLHPLISYAVARTVDFGKLSEDGRAAVQAVRDESAKLIGELNETSSNAEQVLREVRDAAAEQGVTQQAKYFSEEATKHETLAQKWLVTAVISSLSVVAYAISTLFFPFFQLFQGDTVAQAVQLTASKVLVFVVLSALSLQTIKNYAAHRHNAVVNRHRQNALMTYTTLADAGNSPEARDTVLSHAAAAIYSPVDSGYLKSEERGYSAAPSIGLGPRNTIGAGTGGDAA